MVKQHRALVETTISPASSSSPPICWTMVKEAMAVAEPKMGDHTGKGDAAYAEEVSGGEEDTRHDDEPAEADLDEILDVFMYAAPLEERAEHEQQHGVSGGAYLLYGGKQRLGQAYAEQLERNADDRAEDERIFENVYDDAEGVWPFAAEQLKRYHCDGVEHRNDDGDEHNDRACVRAGDESRRKRQTIMTKFER